MTTTTFHITDENNDPLQAFVQYVADTGTRKTSV